MIPYGRQDISEEDIDAVVSVLRSDFLTQGPVVPSFEDAVAQYCGAKYAVAVNSATSALHIACLALGVAPGDLVWTSPITFVASANCALYCGADIDFVDIDDESYNLSPAALEIKLIEAQKAGRLPKVVIPVHLCGQPCDMEKIHNLSLKYDFHIIEDASHAIGGKYRGHPIGNCKYSDITVFSFHPVKIITSAEGGMALTNNANLAERMQLLRSHGVTRDENLMSREPDGPWYYEQMALGWNYRMTELQGALGRSQLKRLDDFVSKRHAIAARYDQLLKEMPIIIPKQNDDDYSGLHLYVVRLDFNRCKETHRQVFEQLRAAGIGVNLHYMPVYLQPFYAGLGFEPGHCPAAEKYYGEAISLPMFSALTDAEQVYVVKSLREATS